MRSSLLSRLSVSVVAALCLSVGLSACSSTTGSAESGGQGQESSAEAKKIDALKYIGDGLKSDYKDKLAKTKDQKERDAIVEEATHISGVVGIPLNPLDLLGDMDQSVFELNEDGTVTATNEEFHAQMSNATHWRVGDRTIDLCTDETCEYYSSWDVTYAPEQEKSFPEHYRFTINTNGVEPDDADNYRLLTLPKK